jgi:hypothetical protein
LENSRITIDCFALAPSVPSQGRGKDLVPDAIECVVDS